MNDAAGWLQQLRSTGPAILPSMLMCRFDDLRGECRRLEEAGVRMLHLDVMDGHFVPNITYGMPIVAAFNAATELPLDVHLMISDPARYASQFADAGANCITFHVEACEDPRQTLRSLRDRGVAAGLAINPSTPLERLMPHLAECDLVLVMSVEAGFGGQAFDETMLRRAQQVRREAPERVLVEMDGGINLKTIRRCHDAGAELLVVGSAIFGNADYESAIAQLRSELPAGS